MTIYQFFSHTTSPSESQDTHREESRRMLNEGDCLDKQTIRSRIVLWHSKWNSFYIVDNNIFRFYISVNDSQGMNLIDCFTHLLYYGCNFILSHWLWPFELMEKLPSSSHLKNNVDIVFIIKVAIHFDDIRVIQKHLNF